jgi:hypothetical protein
MSWARTYSHTIAIAIDDMGAALFFNRNDITISSLCWLQRTADNGDPNICARLASLYLRTWQHSFLRHVGDALEWLSPGHCERARIADRARGRSMDALLT